MKQILLSSFLLVAFYIQGYTQLNADKSKEQLKATVYFLASDRLEGRAPGTPGGRLAATFIEVAFDDLELKSITGKKNYLQPFSFVKERKLKNADLIINYKRLNFGTDFYPVTYSGSGNVDAEFVFVGKGRFNKQKGINDYAGRVNLDGKIFVINYTGDASTSPHSHHKSGYGIATKIENAVARGAAAVIFYNIVKGSSAPSRELDPDIMPFNIPVLYCSKNLSGMRITGKAGIKVNIKEIIQETNNVIGLLDNGANKTIVLGAHFDHLGKGGENSLYRGKEEKIHNGADDNASGISLMLQLANYIKEKGWKNYNYLFIAFGAEEMGLLGSKYFTNSKLMDNFNIHYMLNFDMVGRLDSIDKTLIVNGVGTSPVWQKAISKIATPLNIKTTKSGYGPSDHTSFYLKNIPVLHFFSGTHADYHKPGDDAEKLNYKGIVKIGNFVLNLMNKVNLQNDISFTPTKANKRYNASFSVTLGILPSYSYSGKGLKIDAVNEGETAEKAGIKAGDVLIKLGAYPVRDIYAYMEALSKFESGDKAQAIVLRNDTKKTVSLKFQ